jgi:CO/xanthine dehydrogenase FAD-binding subunit
MARHLLGEGWQADYIDKASAGAAAEAALENARPLKMNGYKVELSKTLVRRALLSLAGGKTN